MEDFDKDEIIEVRDICNSSTKEKLFPITSEREVRNKCSGYACA
jgi:hypothetical protein